MQKKTPSQGRDRRSRRITQSLERMKVHRGAYVRWSLGGEAGTRETND